MARLDFKGKQLVWNHHLAVPFHELIPQKDKSLTDKVSLHDNLILKGDNLLALKALLPTYAGKVKCIYIDPPYNTGNEGWAYNDNVNSPMIKEWLGRTVDRDDLTRHDKWLCMMTPRLKLLRELLRDDGVIFISIDDNEVHHLRSLMDEIFGEENFVANFVWQSKDTPGNNATGIAETHNHLVTYARSDTFGANLLKRSGAQLANYTNPDNDSRGDWLAAPLTRVEHRDRDYYPLKAPSGRNVLPPKGSSWRRPPEIMKRLEKEGRIWWGKKGDASFPMEKKFLSEVKEGVVNQTWWPYQFAGSTRNASAEIKDLFELVKIFVTPKPTLFIKRMLEIATEDDSIVLDSFAGSGTTGHAVLAQNAEDGGNRKFILVELEETVADTITAERVRRVIKGVPNAKDEKRKQGLGGSFSYFELGKPIEIHSILSGERLPSYTELARYVFYTATGEEFDESKIDESRHFIGSSTEYDVFLLYVPDVEQLKKLALTLDHAEAWGKPKPGDKKRLVFAPTKYLDQNLLDEYRISFAQLPFEIYEIASSS